VSVGIICFVPKKGGIALCQHHYLEGYEEGDCETCKIPPGLSHHKKPFNYAAWEHPQLERQKIEIDEEEFNINDYYINCEGFYTKEGCYYNKCQKFALFEEKELQGFGVCQNGYRPVTVYQSWLHT